MVPEDTTAKVPTDPNATKVNADNPPQTPQSELDKARDKGQDANEADVKVQIVNPVEAVEDEVKTTTVEREFVYMHNLDPARQIPGTSKYLDVEQRKEAEIDRAAAEGREPDLENPPSTQGTPYRSADQLRGELPPHAGVKADATFEVSVTEDEAKALEGLRERDAVLADVTVFNDPAKAQDRKETNAASEKVQSEKSDKDKVDA